MSSSIPTFLESELKKQCNEIYIQAQKYVGSDTIVHHYNAFEIKMIFRCGLSTLNQRV